MVDFDCKARMNMVQSPTSNKSPKLTSRRSMPSLSPPPLLAADLSPASDPSCSAYEDYLRLTELRRLWTSENLSGWENEPVIKPALQALEITFRFISIILSDSRPYLNRREWNRRLEKLVTDQVELISVLCEEDSTRGAAPIVDLSSSSGVIVAQAGSTAEVWKMSDGEHDKTVVCRSSESSLLPRLATWQKSADLTSRIGYVIESSMRRCPYTLGLGEPNLEGKPNLDYDALCRPFDLHALKKCPLNHINNSENQCVYTIHQILESWIYAGNRILSRIGERIGAERFSEAAEDCWVLERIWKLLEEIENLHLLMDPDDFLRLKIQLKMKLSSHSGAICFRSRGLVEMTRQSKDLRHRVPEILGVQVDPMGGPIIQEAAMGLYREKRRFEKIHLLQAFQGVESGVKRFFFKYKQLMIIMMGSLEAKANRVPNSFEDFVAQIFVEPTYYPSLDGAKTFIGNFWDHDQRVRNQRMKR